jgi:RHS repeat-associated protein
VTETLPNNLQSTFQYDPENRLSSMTAGQSGFLYNLGPTGIRTGATESTGRTVGWSFDGIYRLTGETVTNDSTGDNGSVSYSLDPVGNRLSQTSSLHNVPTVGFSYGPDDTLLGETYDGNGNVTATGGKTFSYDSQNELISANGGAVTVMYDGFGNRVSKTANGITTKYLVEDDVNPTGYPQVFDELTGSTVTRTYTYGLQRISENQVVDSVWTPSFYGYDGFGTVRQLTNTAGAVTDTFEYDAFGNAITHTGTTPNNYLYRGEQYDPDLGLYYLRARYYNPQTGRFMSRDPREGNPIKPRSLHRYLYVAGDPIDLIDPLGRSILETGDLDTIIGRTPLPALTELAGGTAVQIAEWMLEASEEVAEITDLLAEESADLAQNAADAAADLLEDAADEFDAAVTRADTLGSLARFFVCEDLSFAAADIAGHNLSSKRGELLKVGAGAACAVYFDVLAK